MQRLLLASLVVLAGCGGGSGPIVAEASPAAVDSAALSETGYERVAARELTLEVTVTASVSGDVELQATRDVEATTPVRVYRRDTDAGPAVVSVTSAPAVRPVENQPVARDPLAALSPTDRLAHVQDVYDVSEVAEPAAGRNVTLLGTETTLRVAEATAADGTSLRVFVATVRHGDDFVTVAALVPRQVADAERERVLALLAGVR